MGFTYYGPINGHDLDELINAMEKILDPQARKDLITKMEHQIKHFTWEECAKSTLKLFKTTYHDWYNPLQIFQQSLQSVLKK